MLTSSKKTTFTFGYKLYLLRKWYNFFKSLIFFIFSWYLFLILFLFSSSMIASCLWMIYSLLNSGFDIHFLKSLFPMFVWQWSISHSKEYLNSPELVSNISKWWRAYESKYILPSFFLSYKNSTENFTRLCSKINKLSKYLKNI